MSKENTRSTAPSEKLIQQTKDIQEKELIGKVTVHKNAGWSEPRKINVYLAGKMTGVKDYNYSAFICTAEDIRGLTSCHIVHTACMPRGLRWQDYIDLSLQLIRTCEAIAVLPNSEDSFGVKHELDFARERELPIFYLDEGYDALIDWAKEWNK